MSENRGAHPSLSPAVDRAVAVLDHLSQHPEQPVSSSEIARALKCPKSSINNICSALERQEMLERSSAGYRLGPRVVEIAGRFVSASDPIREFYRAVERSSVLSQETCRLAVLRGTDVLYLACTNGTQPLRLHTSVGDRLPASVTATGKAIYALADNRLVVDRYADTTVLPTMTEQSPRTVPALIEEVSQTRQRGYAIDDQETTPGVSCLAIAFVAEDRIAYGVSVTILSIRWNEAFVARVLPELRAIARRLSPQLRPRGDV